jgi:membrane protein implicated in regulation of membrane protease activity
MKNADLDTVSRTGDVAKGFLIFFCGYFLVAAVGQAVLGQTAVAVFMFIGFSIPLLIVVGDYLKDRVAGTKKQLV